MDWSEAYRVMQRSLKEQTRLPWRDGPLTDFDRCYDEHGFYPALAVDEPESLAEVHPFEGRQAVSVTLERVYDDWCLAQVAAHVGDDEGLKRWQAQSQQYRQIFHPESRWAQPKDKEGRWITPFDPELSGGQGGRLYFTEANSYIYSFHVPHDIPGLIQTMGGRDAFRERLDRLFTVPPSVAKYQFLAQFPDSTGLMGQYPQGNEPSFHIPYLYNYAGSPWQTQRRIREIMRLWFHEGPLGVPGDEDGGAMSAWYVWSALGVYPTCPGKAVYDLGSPIFEQVRIRTDEGREFAIIARNASDRAKYIQTAAVNQTPIAEPRVDHHAWARDGGILEITMGDHPAGSDLGGR
jgi:predicted alpha-1,2-mannosidase